MPVRQFVKGEMGSAEINRLNIAYAKTIRMLKLIDWSDPVSEIIAEKVFVIGTSGVTEPQEIADIVVAQFHKTQRGRDADD
jgi:hypothetical protein